MDAKTFYLAGLLSLFGGIGVQMAFPNIGPVVGSGLSAAGAVFLLRGYMLDRHPERLKRDERTKKIGSYAAAGSWTLTVLFLCALFWIDYFKLISFGVQTAIGVTYIVMVASIIAFRFHYERKGDIE